MTRSPIDKVRPLCAASLLGLLLSASCQAALAEKRHFSIPAQDAADALVEFGQQGAVQFLFDFDEVRGFRTNALSGDYEPADAIRLLIEHTGLRVREQGDGVLLVEPIETRGRVSRTFSRNGVSGQASASEQTRTAAPSAATSGAAAEASDTLALEEIVVTATRRAETARSIPYNIQAISSQTLENSGAVEQADFVRTIPGLSFVDSGPRDGLQLVLRGLRTGPEHGTPTTAVYVDDISIDLFSGVLDLRLLDLERIEVLRGPQGTLYGGGSIGGTIRYITKKPSLVEPEGRVSVLGSSTQHGGFNYNAQAMVSTPLIEDRLALRVSAGRYDNDGYIRSVPRNEDETNSDTTTVGRLVLLGQLTDNLTAELTYHHQRGEYGDATIVQSYAGKYRNTNRYPGGGERETDLTNLSVTYDFGFAALTSSTSYARDQSNDDNDGSFGIQNIYAGFVDPEALGDFSLRNNNWSDARLFTQELRLVSRPGERFDWIAGAFYYRERARSDNNEYIQPGFPGQAAFEDAITQLLADWYGNDYPFRINDQYEYATSGVGKKHQWAVFGELTWHILPQWQASVGIRHFNYEQDNYGYVIDQYLGFMGRDANGFARRTPLPSEFFTGQADDADENFRFNTSYALSEDALMYLTVAEGFREGGFNLAVTGVDPEDLEFQPDTVISYEIGGKLSFADRRVYLSSALFYIDWSDIQTTVFLPSGYSQLGNAGKAVSQGVELELSTRNLLLDGLSLGLGYSYTDVHLTESIRSLGYSGQNAPYVPRHNASLMMDYELFNGHAWRAALNVLATYSSAAYGAFGATFPGAQGEPIPNVRYIPIEESWLMDASVRIVKDEWTARIFIDNVFDEYVHSYRQFEPSFTPNYPDHIRQSVNRPRTVGMELMRRF